MRLLLTPSLQKIDAGKEAVFTVSITNTSSVISSHRIHVLGLDPTWVRIDDPVISLFPDDNATTTLHITLPTSVPSGSHQFVVEVESETPPFETEQVLGEIALPERRAMRLTLDPPSTSAGRKPRIGVLVANTGTAEIEAHLEGHDDPEQVTFDFDPPTVTLGPGEQFLSTCTLRAKRPRVGNPKVRSYKVTATADGQETSAQGSWVQSPLIGRGVLALVGLVVAGTIFAAVIAGSLSQVVDRSNANSQLALQVAQAAQNKTVAGNAALAGKVTLSTNGAPVAGVTVDLYEPTNLGSPAASVATGANGSYRFASLAAGSYELSFTGAGFTQLWYPNSTTASHAKRITLTGDERKTNVNIAIGALPVTVSGQITGLPAQGAEIALQLPTINPLASVSTGANSASAVPNGIVVSKQTVSASGTFTFTNVPSPETYQLVLTKGGDAPVVQTVTLASGESQSGIDLVLTPGNGVISGTVEGPSGDIGGATITASVGSSSSSTVSLTSKPNVGQFNLENLPTPSNVSLVVSAPGYAAQTLSVTLAPAQHATGILVILQPAIGSITGTVTTPANTPSGGVTVSTNEGSSTISTVTASTGRVGSYTLSNLTVPGTYTVTFSRSDLLSQTVIVSLSAGTPNATGENVSMVASTASVQGVVTQTDGSGIANATVQLVSGSATYSVETASAPTAGAYSIVGVTPGTYTLNFTRVGGLPVSTIVQLSAGEALTKDQQLSPAAAITAQVVEVTSNQPVNGAVISLYLSSQYAPGATPLATVDTNTNGDFILPNLQAPQSYLITIAYPSGSAPQSSYNVTTQEGVTVCATNGSTDTSSCQLQLQVTG